MILFSSPATMMVSDSSGSPKQVTVVPLSADTSVSVVRVEVRLSLLTAVIATWNMNPSGPADDDRMPIPSLPNMICVNSAVFTRSGGGVTVHRRLVLFTEMHVRTTGSLGQAAPSPELDVN